MPRRIFETVVAQVLAAHAYERQGDADLAYGLVARLRHSPHPRA